MTETRTLVTKKGKRVETSLSDSEALSILRAMDQPSSFASDLVKKADRKFELETCDGVKS